MKIKMLGYIICTIFYAGCIVKLALLMINRPHSGWNLFIEWFLMATIIAACCWTIYAIKQARPDNSVE
jgi:hypothetical protein